MCPTEQYFCAALFVVLNKVVPVFTRFVHDHCVVTIPIKAIEQWRHVR